MRKQTHYYAVARVERMTPKEYLKHKTIHGAIAGGIIGASIFHPSMPPGILAIPGAGIGAAIGRYHGKRRLKKGFIPVRRVD